MSKQFFRRCLCLLAAVLTLTLAIPAFGGTFQGNGHTISGLSITADGSHQGLFRYLQSGGQVENLNVRGTVAPGGSAEQVGGIAGQSEPDVLISDNKVLSDIRAASDRPSGLVDRAISHADSASGDISARLSEIGSRADSARDSGDLLRRAGLLCPRRADGGDCGGTAGPGKKTGEKAPDRQSGIAGP